MATPSPSPSTTPPATTGNGALPAPSSGSGATPAPSPGSLKDPQGKDISQQDTDSARRRRSDELAAMKPAAPGNAVGFDVQPKHVYYASYMLRNAQYDFADRAKSLVDTLDGYAHAVGCGTGPEAFAKAYAEVADLFLQVWSRATEGVGGAAVGLTVTANNYAQAEHATNPLSPAVVRKNLPDVLKKAGAGGPVAELGWGNAPAEAGWGNEIIDDVAGGLSRSATTSCARSWSTRCGTGRSPISRRAATTSTFPRSRWPGVRRPRMPRRPRTRSTTLLGTSPTPRRDTTSGRAR
ncbi:hypothetical protein ABZ402_32780 [Streptomyces mirabilis]|uniref:hypothetical protein n=1 Tax=Streptomyces mirabilis TaxID=68239 RepID=UPI0033DA4454